MVAKDEDAGKDDVQKAEADVTKTSYGNRSAHLLHKEVKILEKDIFRQELKRKLEDVIVANFYFPRMPVFDVSSDNTSNDAQSSQYLLPLAANNSTILTQPKSSYENDTDMTTNGAENATTNLDSQLLDNTSLYDDFIYINGFIFFGYILGMLFK